jgi:hypothetical protein
MTVSTKIKNISCLLPVLRQPRYIKRTDYLINKGFALKIYYLDRTYLNKNNHDNRIEKNRLAKAENKKYLKRIPELIKSYFKINKDNGDAYYIFSSDLLLIACLARKKK